MAISTGTLLRGSIWTTGAYVVGQGIRLGTNIVLARLLAPEVFGIVWIVYSLRIGLELISDVGIAQSIIYNEDAEDPDFYNTAWTLQLIRSTLLWVAFVAAAVPIARLYQSPILAFIIPVSAFSLVLTGLTSIGKPLLQKRMGLAKLNAFDTVMALFSSVITVLFAFLSPTVWGLVIGGVIGAVPSTVASYFLLPDVRQRFVLSKRFIREIFRFGKWIFVASIVFFLSSYIDRLYLAKVVPLELVGVYGIARSISDLSNNLVMRLGALVLFPFISSHSRLLRDDLRQQLASIRAKFLIAAAIGFAIFVTTADLAIKVLYDARYHAATWILPVLIVGSWFATLASLGESSLLGLGKPNYSAFSNSAKLVFLVIGLPLGVGHDGLVGGVLVIALADIARYITVLVGQEREHFSFGTQDLLITSAFFLLTVLLEWLRWVVGFGTSFESVPIELRQFF
jgi:O-antigen/teichoic acid export membrane protein